MALYIKQNQKRTELQDKLAAELQERARQKAAEQDLPDGVSDSAYVRNTKEGSPFLAVWIVVALIAIGVMIWLIVSSL